MGVPSCSDVSEEQNSVSNLQMQGWKLGTTQIVTIVPCHFFCRFWSTLARNHVLTTPYFGPLSPFLHLDMIIVNGKKNKKERRISRLLSFSWDIRAGNNPLGCDKSNTA